MFTILGGTGLIGSRLLELLRDQGAESYAPERGDPALFARDLGHVIDCIGINDFMERPAAAVEAHATHLVDLFARAKFASFLYLSSTRVYQHAAATNEDTVVPINPTAEWEFFNLTKLLGESLCFGDARQTVRVARLSNVYSPVQISSSQFLPTLFRDALTKGRVNLSVSLASAKDHVALDDVVGLLLRIAASGQYRLYNVAAGQNVSNGLLMEALTRLTGCSLGLRDSAPDNILPAIQIDRAREEFSYRPVQLLDQIDSLVEAFRNRLADRGAAD